MKWYHGTNNPQELETSGIYKRATAGFPNMSDCIYLATTVEEARNYGAYVYEVEYDPTVNKDMNNYNKDSWQIRVYEPINPTKVRLIEGGKLTIKSIIPNSKVEE